MEPNSRDNDYRFSAECVRLLEPVHRLITTHAHEFKLAGQELDSRYSIDACLERAWREHPSTWRQAARAMDRLALETERLRRLEARCNGPRATAWRIEVLGRAKMCIEVEAASEAAPKRTEWTSRSRRFGEALQDFVEQLLPGQSGAPTEGQTWAWAANVLLMFWLTCEPRAEDAVQVSDFQAWGWSTTATELGRFRARFGVIAEDSPCIIEAVEVALRMAEIQLGRSADARGAAQDPKFARTEGSGGSARTETSEAPQPLLSEQAQVFRDILLERQPDEPLTGPKLCDEFLARTGSAIDESAWRTRIRPQLATLGLKNKPRIGYYFPADCRARRNG